MRQLKGGHFFPWIIPFDFLEKEVLQVSCLKLEAGSIAIRIQISGGFL